MDKNQLKHNKILKTNSKRMCVSVLFCRKELMLMKIQTKNGEFRWVVMNLSLKIYLSLKRFAYAETVKRFYALDDFYCL